MACELVGNRHLSPSKRLSIAAFRPVALQRFYLHLPPLECFVAIGFSYTFRAHVLSSSSPMRARRVVNNICCIKD